MANLKEQNDHDGLFKDLIQSYFEEFILLFFPDIYEKIDFPHLNFLDKELGAGVKTRKKRKEEGGIEGKKDAICTFLESRFNGTTDLEGKVRAINDLEVLNKVSKQIFAARSLQEKEDILNKIVFM